jgi:hypothetical protein
MTLRLSSGFSGVIARKGHSNKGETKMTKKVKNEKTVPMYHLFLESADGNSRYAGVAYKHKKGKG